MSSMNWDRWVELTGGAKREAESAKIDSTEPQKSDPADKFHPPMTRALEEPQHPAHHAIERGDAPHYPVERYPPQAMFPPAMNGPPSMPQAFGWHMNKFAFAPGARGSLDHGSNNNPGHDYPPEFRMHPPPSMFAWDGAQPPPAMWQSPAQMNAFPTPPYMGMPTGQWDASPSPIFQTVLEEDHQKKKKKKSKRSKGGKSSGASAEVKDYQGIDPADGKKRKDHEQYSVSPKRYARDPATAKREDIPVETYPLGEISAKQADDLEHQNPSTQLQTIHRARTIKPSTPPDSPQARGEAAPKLSVQSLREKLKKRGLGRQQTKSANDQDVHPMEAAQAESSVKHPGQREQKTPLPQSTEPESPPGSTPWKERNEWVEPQIANDDLELDEGEIQDSPTPDDMSLDEGEILQDDEPRGPESPDMGSSRREDINVGLLKSYKEIELEDSGARNEHNTAIDVSVEQYKTNADHQVDLPNGTVQISPREEHQQHDEAVNQSESDRESEKPIPKQDVFARTTTSNAPMETKANDTSAEENVFVAGSFPARISPQQPTNSHELDVDQTNRKIHIRKPFRPEQQGSLYRSTPFVRDAVQELVIPIDSDDDEFDSPAQDVSGQKAPSEHDPSLIAAEVAHLRQQIDDYERKKNTMRPKKDIQSVDEPSQGNIEEPAPPETETTPHKFPQKKPTTDGPSDCSSGTSPQLRESRANSRSSAVSKPIAVRSEENTGNQQVDIPRGELDSADPLEELRSRYEERLDGIAAKKANLREELLRLEGEERSIQVSLESLMSMRAKLSAAKERSKSLAQNEPRIINAVKENPVEPDGGWGPPDDDFAPANIEEVDVTKNQSAEAKHLSRTIAFVLQPTAFSSADGPSIGCKATQSPLMALRSYRLRKNLYPSSIQLTNARWSHKLDLTKALCPYELHGACNDSACVYQHERSYTASIAEIEAALLEYFPGVSVPSVRDRTTTTFGVEGCLAGLVRDLTAKATSLPLAQPGRVKDDR